MEIRELRNELVHDYEDDPKETSEKINSIFEKKDVLKKYFIEIETYLTRKGFQLGTKTDS
jgi:hypothetical protein